MNIYLKDTDPKFKKLGYYESFDALESAGYWAKANCESFISYGVVEMSDVDSAACDWMGEYRFKDEKDAMWFKLKFS